MRFIVPLSASGRTLQSFLKLKIALLPVARIERALRSKEITVNNLPVSDRKYALVEGDVVEVKGLTLNLKQAPSATPTKSLEILFEDEHVLVVVKPAKVDMHIGPDALDAQVLSYLKQSTPQPFAAAIGQLDKITSGLVIYGKNYAATRALNEAQVHFYKLYEYRASQPASGEHTLTIGHDEPNQREAVITNGKIATTRFYEKDGHYFAELKTGRKHQIRVTLAHLGSPIVGDTKYGGMRARRVYLHATQIGLRGITESALTYLNGKTFEAPARW